MITVRRTLATLLIALFALSPALAQDGKSSALPSTSLTITIAATAERVRFTATSSVVRMHLEVFSEAGATLFDGSSKGNVFDWTLADSTGQRVSDGSYLCVVTAKTLSGKMSQRIGTVLVQGKQMNLRGALASQLSVAQQQAVGPVEENAALTVLAEGDMPSATVIAHDGQNGQVTSTVGALTFRTGDLFSGKETEQMRLTEAGNLGIGTDAPEARLDVNGMVRAREGFQFSDGSVLDVSPKGGGLRVTLPGGKSVPVNLAPNAVNATQNKIPKYADAGGTLTDSTIFEDASGRVGIGTITPQHPFSVRRNGGTLGVHTLGELFVDRDDRTRSASMVLGTAGTLKWIFGMPYQSDGFQIFDLLASPAPGVSRFFVDPTNGNIGIGTNTPITKLQVQTNGYGITQTDGTVTVGSFINGTGGWFGTRSNHPLNFFTNDSLPVMTLSTTGNVGIGTTAPTSKVHVLSATSGVSAIYGESASGRGVYGKSTGSRGVYGESSSLEGVYGISTSGAGVAGRSTSNSGVYGESAAASLTAAGVYGKGTGSGSIGVIGESNLDNATGVLGVSGSPSGYGVYARNNSGGRALFAEGNVGQDINSNGLIKAMVEVNATSSATIARCYNGSTNSSTGNCGFTLTQPLIGVYRIDFGFPVSNRFISVSAEYCTDCAFGRSRNSGANYRRFSSTSIEVFTFATNSEDTQPVPFTLILY